MKRMARIMGLSPEHIPEYKAVHTAVWPEVLACIAASHIRNYSIFLREPENLLFAYWEYHGEDFEADMRLMAANPAMQRWWQMCTPWFVPLQTRAQGELWAPAEHVFLTD